MRTFTDNANRTWTVAVTVDAIRRVQKLCGVNLADVTLGDPPLLARLAADIVLLCDVIYALVKPQADQLGVSDEQFGQSLGADAITAASDAFWLELQDFFQKLRRTDQSRAIEKQTALIRAAVSAVERKIDALHVDQIVDRALTDSGSATNSPASSA